MLCVKREEMNNISWRFVRLIVFIFFSIVLINCKSDPIDELISKEVEEGFPGVGLLVVRNGIILKKSVYGYKLRYDENGRSISLPELVEEETMFDLASLTKMFATNLALMHLVGENVVNVNDPVMKYIEEYRGCNPSNECRETRLIRDLLTHTAGYVPTEEFYDPQRVPQGFYSQNKSLTSQIVLTKLGFDRSRGGEPIYSDIDFMILGLVVERITKMPLDEYVQRNIYDKLNLSHTLFNPLVNSSFKKEDFGATELKGNTRNGTIHFPNVRLNVLRGEVHDEKSFYSMNGLSGHAGLFSNLNDMNILTEILLNNGTFKQIQLWNNEVQQLFLTPYEFDESYGLGWRLHRNSTSYFFGKSASEEAFGHTGWTGTCTVMDPKYSLAIILFTNKRHSPFINGSFISDQFLTGQYGPIMNLVYETFIPSIDQ